MSAVRAVVAGAAGPQAEPCCRGEPLPDLDAGVRSVPGSACKGAGNFRLSAQKLPWGPVLLPV
jgi:hypothetical protein